MAFGTFRIAHEDASAQVAGHHPLFPVVDDGRPADDTFDIHRLSCHDIVAMLRSVWLYHVSVQIRFIWNGWVWGRVLEDYFRTRIGEEWTYTEVGCYWTRDGTVEVDIVVCDDIDRKAHTIEVKRNPKKMDMNDLIVKGRGWHPT